MERKRYIAVALIALVMITTLAAACSPSTSGLVQIECDMYSMFSGSNKFVCLLINLL